jgi:malonyl-CoA O-methyltransferase
MTADTLNISKHKIRRAFDRAADSYDDAAVLQKEVCSRLLERLDYVRLEPQMILDLGVGTGEAITPLMQRYNKASIVALDLSEQMLHKAKAHGRLFRKPELVCADLEALPFADNSFDLVFSSLALQWCNNLGETMKGLLRVLKPGGLLMFATFGPDTLKELKASWQNIDDTVHVNPFVDMHDVGDEMLNSGFADPVIEAEVITVTYDHVDRLMQDLRDIGANVKSEGFRSGLTTPAMMRQLSDAYETYRVDGDLPASYEVVYGHAWKAQAVDDSKSNSVQVDVSLPGQHTEL